jgi:hypothetical protein
MTERSDGEPPAAALFAIGILAAALIAARLGEGGGCALQIPKPAPSSPSHLLLLSASHQIPQPPGESPETPD